MKPRLSTRTNSAVHTAIPKDVPITAAPRAELATVRLGELLVELSDHLNGHIGSVDTERAVRGAEFYDPFDPQADSQDMLLLAPSITSPSAEALEQLALHAQQSGAPAVAIKCTDSAVALLNVITSKHRIPFLRVPNRLSWRLFDALLAHALGERRHSDDAHRDRGTEPLFSLANELAEHFGGSVAIEDLGRRIIAYSSVPDQLIDPLRTQGILTRQVPSSPFNDDQYRTVLRSSEPIKYPRLDNEEPRVAFAIRAGTLPLGTVWAIDASGEDALTLVQRDRIVDAASVAASHMLENLQVRNATQLPREDRCRTLLDGHQVAGSELAELGIAEERGAALVAFAPAPGAQSTAQAQLRSTVQRHLSLHHTEAVTVTRGAHVYALVAHDTTRPLIALIEPLLPIVDRLIGPGTLVALPGVAHRASAVAALRELGDRLLALVAHPTQEVASMRIATVETLQPRLLFEQAGKLMAGAPELRNVVVDALAQESPDFASTLASWCANFGNVARTARALGVHENTVRYRVRQIEQHYGLPLGDPEVLLAVWLQLRATQEHPTATE